MKTFVCLFATLALASAAPSPQGTTGSLTLNEILSLSTAYLQDVVDASPAAQADPTLAATGNAAIKALAAVGADVTGAVVPATADPTGNGPVPLPGAGKTVGEIPIDDLASAVQSLAALLAADPKSNPTGVALLNLATTALGSLQTKLQAPPSDATNLPSAQLPARPLPLPLTGVNVPQPASAAIPAPVYAGYPTVQGYPYPTIYG